ncbi:uncharacterized protein OCT59_005040 [Rhizophagus irregularis]|uniref:uncharacterized protein n=1 Tax=Rhizophagus irregularis TaxID=588596 RepID=UPI00332FDA46|nr:hypothetical protein OCT59_005040 [Rhizophagus irregularis]
MLKLMHYCWFNKSFQRSIFFLTHCIPSRYDITQNISFIYEEPINGLKLYTTLVTVDYLMIWMAFEDEDPECMLPYFHLRIINKITGQTNYIDLNYTLPAEAVYPININLLPLTDNYMIEILTKYI